MRYCGLDVLGATGTKKWFARAPKQPLDTYMNPSQVLVNPHAAASSTYANVASVSVYGGERWVPGWKKGVTAYTKPQSATLHLFDGSKKVFNAPDAVEVTNGSMSTMMMGDAGTGGAPSVIDSATNFASMLNAGAKNSASDLPTDGRPAKGWSQPQPVQPVTPPTVSLPWWKIGLGVLAAVSLGVGTVAVVRGIR